MLLNSVKGEYTKQNKRRLIRVKENKQNKTKVA